MSASHGFIGALNPLQMPADFATEGRLLQGERTGTGMLLHPSRGMCLCQLDTVSAFAGNHRLLAVVYILHAPLEGMEPGSIVKLSHCQVMLAGQP